MIVVDWMPADWRNCFKFIIKELLLIYIQALLACWVTYDLLRVVLFLIRKFTSADTGSWNMVLFLCGYSFATSCTLYGRVGFVHLSLSGTLILFVLSEQSVRLKANNWHLPFTLCLPLLWLVFDSLFSRAFKIIIFALFFLFSSSSINRLFGMLSFLFSFFHRLLASSVAVFNILIDLVNVFVRTL